MKIAPSILSADFTRLGEEIRAVEAAGADQIHIDVMDGRFVPAISFGLPIVEAARQVTTLPLDVHLMIVEPEKHLSAFAQAGADMLTVHVEACSHLHRTLQEIRGLGIKAGVALNPHTPFVMLTEIVHLVDLILVMTVNPGAGGQAFLREMLEKISVIRRMIGQRQIDLSVDGGIDATTARDALRAGANVLVAGSSIFKAPEGIPVAMQTIRDAGAV
jgi:ribulose-phosphate 3-epimerase